MRILHFISHTHWDREWHEPFQLFRIRLAQTIDKALDILATDPEYKFFMLDGQTIVLEDYLEIQSEREAELRAHIKSGRILIGPWYILPDEFLVSGEAIIRNLQRGIRLANSFGKCMMIGYIPDPFGHISQMPQLLAGFGIHVAMFRRGLADEPTELWWEGADGTPVLTTYLRDGYDNAAWLAREPMLFAEGVKRLVASLEPYAVTPNLLMMHGTDHMQPWENLPRVMREAEELIPDVHLIHSNLPDYARSVEKALTSIAKENLTVVKGELRNPKRHHLLPGVTSTRMWIKQRNARAQVLLEQWAEPLAAVEMNLPLVLRGVPRDRRPELHLAWKYLLQNHPHDSICGCSADQVHLEMAPRFDWVEQIGGEVAKGASETIARSIDTRHETQNAIPILVFNPTAGPRCESVQVQVDLPPDLDRYQITGGDGFSAPLLELARHADEYASVTATADDLRWMFGAMKSGQVDGHKIREMAFRVESQQVFLKVIVSDQSEVNPARLGANLAELDHYVADPQIKTFHVRVVSLDKVDLVFFARDLPGYGYKTYWLTKAANAQPRPIEDLPEMDVIENEFFRIEPNPEDGTLTIADKTTGAIFNGANRFVDGGDCGDLYNHCPPERDTVVDAPIALPLIDLIESNSLRRILRIQSSLQVPVSLTPDRRSRSLELVNLPILTEVTLYAGSRRIDFRTQVENKALDHRLRVEFPTPIHADKSYAAQAFDLVAREINLAEASSQWVEKPVPTKPMQGYCGIGDEQIGLVLATRGLPEYEVKPESHETDRAESRESNPMHRGDEDKVEGIGRNEGARLKDGSTIALTLLRCVGWLSRPDLTCRRGDAGPEKSTPGAQEIGTHLFEYSLIPHSAGTSAPENGLSATAKTLDGRGAHFEALAFNALLQAMPTDQHEGPMPSSASWVQVSPPDFVLTAIKPPEEGDGLIVRGFNAGDNIIKVRLQALFPFAQAQRVNLNEDVIAPIFMNQAHEVELTVKPREIVTVLLRGRLASPSAT